VIAKGARPLVMKLQNYMALSKNMTILSASSDEEISSTFDEKRHGLFTYFLFKGIKNEDVVNPDGSSKWTTCLATSSSRWSASRESNTTTSKRRS